LAVEGKVAGTQDQMTPQAASIQFLRQRPVPVGALQFAFFCIRPFAFGRAAFHDKDKAESAFSRSNSGFQLGWESFKASV